MINTRTRAWLGFVGPTGLIAAAILTGARRGWSAFGIIYLCALIAWVAVFGWIVWRRRGEVRRRG